MSTNGVHEFTLTDAQGAAHSYLVTEHPAGEGTEIVFELLGLGAPTALQLVGAALASDDFLRAVLGAMGGDGLQADATATALQQLAAVDLGKVGAELSRSFAVGKAPVSLVRRIVANATRDGQRLSTAFDRAYQANYWELAQLVGKVIAINRFFPGLPTSAS
jgi:hypothetical protein